MDITRRTSIRTRVTVELADWEARDLEKMLTRIRDKKFVSKSEFSLREKSTGRRLLQALRSSKKSKE